MNYSSHMSDTRHKQHTLSNLVELSYHEVKHLNDIFSYWFNYSLYIEPPSRIDFGALSCTLIGVRSSRDRLRRRLVMRWACLLYGHRFTSCERLAVSNSVMYIICIYLRSYSLYRIHSITLEYIYIYIYIYIYNVNYVM